MHLKRNGNKANKEIKKEVVVKEEVKIEKKEETPEEPKQLEDKIEHNNSLEKFLIGISVEELRSIFDKLTSLQEACDKKYYSHAKKKPVWKVLKSLRKNVITGKITSNECIFSDYLRANINNGIKKRVTSIKGIKLNKKQLKFNPDKHLYCEISSLVGMLLQNVLNPNSGFKEISYGKDVKCLSGVIVRLDSFSSVYVSFKDEDTAKEFCYLMNSLTQCNIIDVFNDEDDYHVFNLDYDEKYILQLLDKLQILQLYEDYCTTPHGMANLLYKICHKYNKDNNTEIMFGQRGFKDPYDRLLFRYGGHIYNSLEGKVISNGYDRLGVKLLTKLESKRSISYTLRRLHSINYERDIVSANSLNRLLELSDRVINLVPEKIKMKIVKGKYFSKCHIGGFSSLTAYKILQFTLSTDSGVKDIFLKTSNTMDGSYIISFDNFSDLGCSFINEDKMEKFMEYMGKYYNLSQISILK